MLLDNFLASQCEALMTNRKVLVPSAGAGSAGIALWRRVADGLERAVADSIYPANDRLPGEMEIAERFGVNRHTVRRAIAALTERGILRAERGSGTYVEPAPISYPIRSRMRFSEIVGTAGRAANGRLLASAVESADRNLARQLDLKPGAPVIRLETLREADRVPICVATAWLPAERFAGAAKIYAAKRSVTRMLAHFGVEDYRRAATRITAALANAADAMRLRLEPGGAVVMIESTDVDVDGRPVLASHSRFAGERVSFVVES